MIDVIFQLLIFFLCTAGFVVPEAVLPTELPPTGAVATVPRPIQRDADPIRVLVEGTSGAITYRLNDQALSGMSELLDRLGQLGKITAGSPVILDIGKDVPIGPVIDLYDETLTRGFSSIHFAAERRAKPVNSK
ncbi:biopolymer transporter ExbD [bacterium]|nr:biopolymer transporter ExbD [bacterium]